MTKIGFIGLGNMGLPMANVLKDNGFNVLGFDVGEQPRLDAAKAGHVIGANIGDVVREAEIVITMLPNGEISKSVAAEILPFMQDHALLIDCSTIDVESAQIIHQMMSKAGKLCLDAPVSGGIGGAAAGSLTFMVGGSEDAFKIGAPALDAMGQKAVHCGDGGSGQSAKICNNMLLGISMIGTCEAFALAEKLGLSQSKLFDVVSTSSGSCWSVNTYCPVPDVGPKSPADNDFNPGFAAGLMLKDLNLAQEAANSVDGQTPLGAHATALYHQMVEDGHADMDFSAMINNFMESDQES